MAANGTCANQKFLSCAGNPEGYREKERRPGESTEMAKVEKRPEALTGKTYKAVCGCGTIYVTINENNGQPFEVFINFGKSGKCANITLDAIAISISHGLRAGVHLEEYMRAFRGYSCELRITGVQNKGTPIQSCVDAVAQTFLRHLREKGEGITPTEGKKLTDPFPAESSSPARPAPATEKQGRDDCPELNGNASGAEAAPPEPAPEAGNGANGSITEVTRLDAEPEQKVLDVRGGLVCKNCGGGPIRFEGACDYCMACGFSENCGG